MSFPTSYLNRNAVPTFRRQNTAPERAHIQSENAQNVANYPTRRTFDVAINNIESMSNQIGSLLSVVNKNQRKTSVKKQLNQVSNQGGYLQYKKRIKNLEKLQEAYEAKEQLILPEKYVLKYHQKHIYEHKVGHYLRQDPLIHKYNYEQLEDKTPVSRPSGTITPPKVNYYGRSRSPLFINKPSSKYIVNQKSRNLRKNQNQPPEQHPKERQKSIPLEKFQVQRQRQRSNLRKKSEEGSIINNSFKPVEKLQREKIVKKVKIDKEKQLKQKYTQIRPINEPKRPAPRNTKVLQKIQQQRERESQVFQNNQKFKPEAPVDNFSDNPTSPIIPEKQPQIQTNLSLKKLITFSEFSKQTEKQSFPSPIQNLIQIPSPSNFEIKVYPCDLNKDTIKTFIADRIASVIKVDNQFTQLKKIFLVHQFQERLRLPDKKIKLLRVLWDRGLMIDQGDLEYTINFDVDTKNMDLQSIQQNNFGQFVQKFVDKYLQAEYEWQKKVLHMVTTNQIQHTFFKPAQLDLQNKGYIRVENLACFVNLYATDSPCFSNKEVDEVFNRFLRHEPYTDKLSYQGFLHVISRRLV